jgi:uncharacterized protein YbaP (TraB family)
LPTGTCRFGTLTNLRTLKDSLLWRLQPRAGTDGAPSYLFGTMHVRDLRAFDWLPLAKRCLDQCTVFATEFDFSTADHHALTAALQLPTGLTLEDLLPPRAWKNLERYARRQLGLPVESLRRQHPMPLSGILLEALLQAEAPCSLDETLWHYARENGKTTTGVETFDEQLGTLSKISFEQHLENLTWLLTHYARQHRRIKKMLDWYRAGDITQLYRATKRDAKGLRRVLLYDRNVVMAERLVEFARMGPVFCAVGAGHLAGQKGMLRLLKQAGLRAEAVEG